jgi:transposase-like protein
MKGKKHKPEQNIRKLREAGAMLSAVKTIGQVCQALEISEQTYYRWRDQATRVNILPRSLPAPAKIMPPKPASTNVLDSGMGVAIVPAPGMGPVGTWK